MQFFFMALAVMALMTTALGAERLHYASLEEESAANRIFLQALAQDSVSVLSAAPTKFNRYGARVYPRLRDRSAKIKTFSEDNKSDIDLNIDHPQRLLQYPAQLNFNIHELDKLNLQRATLPQQPWSDDYWAINRGLLGFRYNDPQMVELEDRWSVYWNYILQHPTQGLWDRRDYALLSPSEKYDLLIGDGRASLTQALWLQGQQLADAQGSVANWMGICHGWAAASFMVARPQKTIWARSFDGRHLIPFTPSDLKGLISLLWANGLPLFSTRYVGGRCDIKNPLKDPQGRVNDPRCFDNNPGSWHLALLHRLGREQRSFVMDATYDLEVWNYPVVAYNFRYFNPMTGDAWEQASKAMIEYADFKRDKFREYRSLQTHFLVGVRMNVSYMVETNPSARESDGPEYDEKNSVVYRYDLELDRAGHILGGEWYTNLHPDFLWTPVEQETMTSGFEPSVQERSVAWKSSEQRLPPAWQAAAVRAARSGRPLATILERLLMDAQVVNVAHRGR